MKIALIVFGVVLLVALIVLLFSSSQALARFAVLETLLIAFVGFVVFTCYQNGILEKQTICMDSMNSYYSRLPELVAEIEKDSTDQQDIESVGTQIQSFFENSTKYIYGIEATDIKSYGVYDLTKGSIAYSNVETENDKAKNEMIAKLSGSASLSSSSISYDETDEGEFIYAAVADSTKTSTYCVYGVVSLDSMDAAMEEVLKQYIISGLIALAIISAVLGLVLYLQSIELRLIVRRIQRAATGLESWDFLYTKVPGFFPESDDIRTLRMSLNQLVNNDERNRHELYEKMLSYYRFAPHYLEEIYDSKSVKALKAGDRVEINGISVMISLNLPENFNSSFQNKVQSSYLQINEAKTNHGGMLVYTDHDMSEMLCLFNKDTQSALEFGMDVTRESDAFVLLHKNTVGCGIIGCDDEVAIYNTSMEIKQLEKYTDRLRKMGLQMVVTDRVYELMNGSVKNRYIGFVENDGTRYKLYEILDICNADIRTVRMEQAKKFQEAINLFYQDDFYLARNMFSDILKEDTSDAVSMHYLFVCEENLNANGKTDISYALFSGEK